MKKSLLSISLVLIGITLFAQTNRIARLNPSTKYSINEGIPSGMSFPKDLMKHRSLISSHNRMAWSPATFVYQLGTAPNAFGVANGGRTNLWYDQDLNSMMFLHRSGVDVAAHNTGYYRFDLSVNGGIDWAIDQGPVFGPLLNAANEHGARYPVGVIYNPTGNTDAMNAYVPYNGPWNIGAGWLGQVWGTGKLDGLTTTEHFDQYPLTTSFVDNMFVVKNTGTVWRIGRIISNDATLQTYQDTVALFKGTFNTTTHDFDFENRSFYMHVNPDWGTPLEGDIAFSDDGQIGYMAFITNDDSCHALFVDTTSYVSVFKTTNGGNSWSQVPTDLNISSVFDPLLANDGSTYGAGGDLDVVVDANNNLHIVVSVLLAPNHSGLFINLTPGTFGIFDIYTTDQGTTWKGQLLEKPETFRGNFGDGSTANPTTAEDARPFASRNWDGSKLFFSWFDTDTAIFGTTDNLFCDMHSIGYDVTSGQWTTPQNMTTGTDADGLCTFGNGSYYATDDDAGNYTIPMVYQVLSTAVSVSTETSFQYAGGAGFANSDFTVAGTALDIPVLQATACGSVGINVPTTNNSFSVSANYPNPFNGHTSVDVTLEKATNITIEVTNIVGQILSTTNYTNLHSGINTLTIDGSALAKGLYTYKVKAGGEVITRTMSIQ